MTNSYKQRREALARMRQQQKNIPNAPYPPRNKQVKLIKVNIIKLWHIRNSNSLIYLWRNKWNEVIRTHGYNYQFMAKEPEKPKITLKDLGKPPGEAPKPIADLVKKIMEEIDNMASSRTKRALRGSQGSKISKS